MVKDLAAERRRIEKIINKRKSRYEFVAKVRSGASERAQRGVVTRKRNEDNGGNYL